MNDLYFFIKNIPDPLHFILWGLTNKLIVNSNNVFQCLFFFIHFKIITVCYSMFTVPIFFKIISTIIICLFFSAVAGAQQTTLICGGKYIGYDDQFLCQLIFGIYFLKGHIKNAKEVNANLCTRNSFSCKRIV